MKRRLDNYGVKYECAGGSTRRPTFIIQEITKPFTLYSIMDLGFNSRTDFRKVMHFYFYYFEDEFFMSMSDLGKEHMMRDYGCPISRQTVTNYIRRLTVKEFVFTTPMDFIYYFAHQEQRVETDRATYSKAWREYWDKVHADMPVRMAIYEMKVEYGGVARKEPRVLVNGIYNEEIEYMRELLRMEMEGETLR